MHRLTRRGVPFQQWVTLQQAGTVLDALPALGIPEPDQILAVGRSGRPLAGSVDVVVWLAQIARWAVRNRRSLRRSLGKHSVVVVHGDTMTSVVGAVLAKFFRLDSAHVEAGLRSGDWRNPFPEELDRRIVGRLATVHYAPNDLAAGHLRGRRNVVMTQGNTVVDAVLDGAHEVGAASDDPYGVLLLHRFEFLGNETFVRETLARVLDGSPHRLVMVVDDLARHALRDAVTGLPPDKVTIVDKMPHSEFSALLAGAAFVVTDSGGVQEETALLGIPALIHRRATERNDGLGANVLLSEWKLDTMDRFLRDFESYRREPLTLVVSPSDAVVDDLVSRGYGN
ncbi:UDP-N-acetylglucosamine 2-epimerase [Pengzhenrongella frigida]|nr:UDP-N-acetylglucosamine 2-epimerase [Cellulomonas sp. HLT2-17]